MARVEGFEPAHSGQQPIDVNGNAVPVGVWGDSTTGVGVLGTTGTLPSGTPDIPVNIAGVEGHGLASPGVIGLSVEDTGVVGESVQGLGMLARSLSGNGLLGVTFAPSVPGEPPSAAGVFGSSVAGGNGVTGFVGSETGVVGSSVRGTGVRGSSGDRDGVSGFSLGANGVRGVGGGGGREIGSGVFGSSESGFGVRGVSTNRDGTVGVTFGRGVGINGLHFSTQSGTGVSGVGVLSNGIEGFSFSEIGVRGEGRTGGVHGITNSTESTVAAIIGENRNGLAGLFLGNVRITGSLSKGGGGFEIDHPLDPANKRLSHSFVESPDMLNMYNGNVTTDGNAEAVVALPPYFEALNEEFRYQLTVIGQFAQAIIAEEVRENRFTIKSDRPGVKVSWQVTGIRKDPWAVAHRIQVEADKTAVGKSRSLPPPQSQGSGNADRREGTSRTADAEQVRRIADLLPPDVRSRVEELLGAGRPSEGVDVETLHELIGTADADARNEGVAIDRTRLEEEWRRLETAMQNMRPAIRRKD